jgi:DNA-binding transcriptional ArsR family regulator
MSLLPSEPDTSAADADAEPRVIGVDSDDAEDVISALSSETARKLLSELHEEPAPPSKLADRAETSLQNAQYHLEKLQAAGAVSVVDTAYSAKGREMDVYAPADEPLVIFAGDEEKSSGLKAALSRFIGSFGALALGSLAIQELYGSTGGQSNEAAPAGGADAPDADGGPVGTATPGGNEETVAPSSQTTTTGDGGIESGEVLSTTADGTYSLTNASGSEEVVENVTSVRAVNGTEFDLGENVTVIADEIVIETAGNGSQAVDAAATTAGIEPGLAFFAGGLVILSLWLGAWYVANR